MNFPFKTVDPGVLRHGVERRGFVEAAFDHADPLGASPEVDTLSRAAELRAPLLLVWGSRDPHIPPEGRAKIHAALDRAGARYESHTFDAEHAFMRDEGPRYDPRATDAALEAMFAFFAKG